jgi:hypothetical protein
MRIDFERSGGFANLMLTCHLNTDGMPKDQAEELMKLVDSSGVFDLQQSDVTPAAGGGPPDVFLYRLSLSDGSRQKTLSFNDVIAPVSLRPLLVLLQKLALDEKRKGI